MPDSKSQGEEVSVRAYTQVRDGQAVTVRAHIRGDPPGGDEGSRIEGRSENPLGPFADVRRRQDCEIQVLLDEARCRLLGAAGGRARCYQSANARYGACTNGRPLPPLITW